MASLMLLNVALFMPVVAGGFLAAWLGWRLAAPDRRDPGGDDDGGGSPVWPSPVAPRRSAGRNDLARSA